MDHSTDLAR